MTALLLTSVNEDDAAMEKFARLDFGGHHSTASRLPQGRAKARGLSVAIALNGAPGDTPL
jgi:hypothetical protein